MARGKLPRSYKIANGDTNVSYQPYAYLNDASLAVIAVSGLKKISLAEEIINGIAPTIISNAYGLSAANYLNDATIVNHYDCKINMLEVYAYAYYMEMNPSTTLFCTLKNLIIGQLQFINGSRSFAINGGLVVAGWLEDTLGTLYTNVLTETNIYAYFAFKQAAKVLNNSHYSDAADEIKTAIINKLWSGGKLNNGLSSTGVLDTSDSLSVNALGSLFFSEIGDSAKANACLIKCESFAITDQTTGCNGYTGLLGTPDNVWIEMSYAVALAYFRAGNFTKYKQVTNELNKFIGADGGISGGNIKASNVAPNELLKSYESTASTAWSIIANILKNSAFTIRTSISPTVTCSPTVYFNDLKTYTYTKAGCGGGYTGSSVVYTIPAGRYINYSSVASANDTADVEASTYGQAYANATGTCIPTSSVGNAVRTGTYTKNDCGSGLTGNSYTVTVAANTYYAVDLATANGMADSWISANGQSQANTYGTCSSPAVINNLFASIDSDDGVYITARVYADYPVNTNVYATFTVKDNSPTPVLLDTFIKVINTGDSSSLSIRRKYNTDGGGSGYSPPFTATITSISPSSYGSMTYTF